jgi:pyridoxal/pyridoxine/pyridoxamine kinase
VARIFPLALIGTAVWLFTTVVWSDTFGPEFHRGAHEAPGPATT